MKTTTNTAGGDGPAELRVCPACGAMSKRRLSATRPVRSGAVESRVCKPCRYVGADLVLALGLPPDVLLGASLEEADV